MRLSRWPLVGAILSAVGASACCLGPLVLLTMGVSGAWISNLTALEQYRPVFVALTLGLLGWAFYQTYGRSRAKDCDKGKPCANPKVERLTKVSLMLISAFTLGLLAFPYVIPLILAAEVVEQQVQTKQVVLKIQNMTCAACPITVRKSILRLDGVKEVTATLKPPQAVIIYDPTKVSVTDLTSATRNAGYPSSVKN